MSLQEQIDSALATLQARLAYAESQWVVHWDSAQAQAAERAISQAQVSYDWLSNEGRDGVLNGSIPVERWTVAAEGMADLLSELGSFNDKTSFLNTLGEIGKATVATIKAAGPDTSTLVILAVIVVGLVILRVA